MCATSVVQGPLAETSDPHPSMVDAAGLGLSYDHRCTLHNRGMCHLCIHSIDLEIWRFSASGILDFFEEKLSPSRTFSKVLLSLKNADAQALLRASFDRWRHNSGLPRNDVIGAPMAPMATSHPQKVEGSGRSP